MLKGRLTKRSAFADLEEIAQQYAGNESFLLL
jgi:hypothetical protein